MIPFSHEPRLIKPEQAVKRHAVPDDPTLHQKWGELVQQNQARTVSDGSPGFYSPSFLIPKKEKGTWRLISDLRRLNRHVLHEHVKMPNINSILPSLRKGSLMATFDVKDGYFNVPIAPQCRCYFRFVVGTKVYELLRLPMGFVGSMQAFNQWLKPYVETVRALFPELQVFSYVDDCLIVLPRQLRVTARKTIRRVRATIKALGLPLKHEKCTWEPSTKAEFLGFVLNTRDLSTACPRKKARKIRKQIRQTVKQAARGTLRTRAFASTIGMIIALLPAARNARLHAAHLFEAQAKALGNGGWANNPKVRLSAESEAELNFWLNFLQNAKGYPLGARYTCHEVTVVATDAADDCIAGCMVSAPSLPTFSRSLSRRERRRHINYKELQAVMESRRHFKLKGTWVNFRVDNTTVVAAINKWSTKAKQMLPLLMELHDWALRTNTKVTATYINTKSNVVADRLSRGLPVRQQDLAEMRLLHRSAQEVSRRARWRLHPSAARDLFRAMRIRPRRSLAGPATTTDTVLPAGFVPLELTRTRRLRSFVFPNLSQIQRTLTLVESLRLDTVVFLPLWPGAPWFHRVAHLAAGNPVLLPPTAARPFNQRRTSLPTWSWLSIKLSGRKSARMAFRRQLRSQDGSSGEPWPVTATGGAPWRTLSARTRIYVQRLMQLILRAKH